MKEETRGDQIGRVLQIYSKLSDGYIVNKAEVENLQKRPYTSDMY